MPHHAHSFPLSQWLNKHFRGSQRLFDVQKQLGYPDRARIDREAAGRVAREAGASRLLSGSIMRAPCIRAQNFCLALKSFFTRLKMKDISWPSQAIVQHDLHILS